MIKTFDCVEMKHKAGRKIAKKLANLTMAQQLKYWQERHKNLKALKEKLSKAHK